jgi:hypothetical protein
MAEAEGEFCCTEDKSNITGEGFLWLGNSITFHLYVLPASSTSSVVLKFHLSLIPVKVIICPDGTSRWRASASRCDVFVDCRQKLGFVMHGIGKPSRWGTWWAIDGNDTKDVLLSLTHL